MKASKKLCYSILVLLLIAMLLGDNTGLAAPEIQEATWVITYPSDGTTVSGEVTILGTASHSNFDSYGLLYATGSTPTGNSQWVPIVFGVKSMVVNGPLATWDTTELPNGQYTLALALYEVGNSEPKLFFVNNITVQNEEATPTPEATPTETAPEPTQEQAPTPGEGQPGAAPIGPTVDLPPTATPRPTPTLGADETPEPEESGLATTNIFSMDALRETFCSGVQIAVLLYVFGGLYVAAKAAWRYYRRYQRRYQRSSHTSEPGNQV